MPSRTAPMSLNVVLGAIGGVSIVLVFMILVAVLVVRERRRIPDDLQEDQVAGKNNLDITLKHSDPDILSKYKEIIEQHRNLNCLFNCLKSLIFKN